MVNTNFQAGTGGAIVVTPNGNMLLLCGPIDWDTKQFGAGSWNGAGPTTMRITIEVDLQVGVTLSEVTGLLEKGRNTNWAVAIPVGGAAEAVQDAVQNAATPEARGTKEYPGFDPSKFDALKWQENLPIVRAQGVASAAS